jgi:hypothetical protein
MESSSPYASKKDFLEKSSMEPHKGFVTSCSSSLIHLRRVYLRCTFWCWVWSVKMQTDTHIHEWSIEIQTDIHIHGWHKHLVTAFIVFRLFSHSFQQRCIQIIVVSVGMQMPHFFLLHFYPLSLCFSNIWQWTCYSPNPSAAFLEGQETGTWNALSGYISPAPYSSERVWCRS